MLMLLLRRLPMIIGAIVLFVAGLMVGGSAASSKAGDDHTELVVACIQTNGGSITESQLHSCIAQASAPQG